MISYQKYSEECKRFNVVNPYPDEEAYNRAYGIITDDFTPLSITPKRDDRKVSASLENHIAISNESKAKKARKAKPVVKKSLPTEKAKEEPKPKKPKYIPKTDRKMSPKADLKSMTPEELAEYKKMKGRRHYAAKLARLGKTPNSDPLKKQRISLEGMSEEQIRAHRAELRRLRRARKKRDGLLVEKKTPAQLAKQREYNKRYHQEKKKDPAYQEKRRQWAKNYRERHPEKVRDMNQKWREDNLERSREINRNSKRKTTQLKRLQSSASNGSKPRSPERINKDMPMLLQNEKESA